MNGEATARKILFPCPACGASHVLGENTHRFSCRVCGHVTRFFRCKGCRGTFAAQHDPALDNEDDSVPEGPPEIRCSLCRLQTKARAQRPGRLIAAHAEWGPLKKFYANFKVDFDDAVRFAGRRVIYGEILVTTGLDGLRAGMVMISFDRDALYVHAGEGYEIPYERIRLIQILTRDEVVATPPRDIVATLVADDLLTKVVTPSESVLAVAWGEGSFVILNHSLRREELEHVLEAYISQVPKDPTNFA